MSTPYTYDPSVALIVVDVQNDFADPAGSLYVRGGETIPDVVNAEIRQATEAGAPVFYTQDWHPPETPHFQTGGGPWPVHCVARTWGAELHPKLQVAGPVVPKGTGGEDGYSGFTVEDPQSGARHPTELQRLLEERGITTVVVTGLATDYCVKATALDARANGLRTVVPLEAVRAVGLGPGDEQRALDAMAAAGVELVGTDPEPLGGERGGRPTP